MIRNLVHRPHLSSTFHLDVFVLYMTELVDEQPLQQGARSKEQAAKSKELASVNLWFFAHTKRVTCVFSFAENSSIKRCQSREVAFHSEMLYSARRCRQSKENVMVSWEHETGSGRRRAAVSTRDPLDNVNNRNIKTFGAENDLVCTLESVC